MIDEKKKLRRSDLRNIFIRSNLFQASWNFERMQALGFCFSILPVIKRLYPQNGVKRQEALKRHLEFFNTHPYVSAPIQGVVAALEEERANGADIDNAAISGLKVGMMGPLAGVGDPIFWGTVRPIFAALGATLAQDGRLIGPILFFVLFNLVRLSVRYFSITYGYKKGLNIINDMGGGIFQKITEGASILGLFIMGALVNKWTHVNVHVVVSDYVVNGKHQITTLQNILDQLLPGLIPLLLTFSCMWLLRKKVNPLTIIIGFFVLGISGAAFNFLAL